MAELGPEGVFRVSSLIVRKTNNKSGRSKEVARAAATAAGGEDPANERVQQYRLCDPAEG